jgi:hypothetical protein
MVAAIAGLANWASLPLRLVPHLCHLIVSLPQKAGAGEVEDRKAMDL